MKRLPIRGGNWNNGATSGVFALNLNNARLLAVVRAAIATVSLFANIKVQCHFSVQINAGVFV